MIVSHVILTKDGRNVALGGSWHKGDDYARSIIQKNIDDAAKEEYLFFREGFKISGTKPIKLSHKLIAYFLMSLIGKYYRAWVRAKKAVYIEEELRFPDNKLYVDMGPEIINKLDEAGLTKYWPLFFVLHLCLVLSEFYSGFIVCSGIIFNFIIDRGSSVFVEERDRLVARAIEDSSAPKIYVHYGDFHIKGIRDILVQKGWHVQKENLIPYHLYQPLKFREALKITIQQTRLLLRYYAQQYAWRLSDRHK